MKKAILIGAAVLLVLCCAGGAAVVAFGDTGTGGYASAPDPCDLPEVSRFGKVHARKATGDGCVVEVGDRIVTVVATVAGAKGRYEAARRAAGNPQAAEGEWAEAFVTDLVVAFLDENLFLSLETNQPGDVRSILLTMARELLQRLRKGGEHHRHHDLFDD